MMKKILMVTFLSFILNGCGYRLKQAVDLDKAYEKTSIRLAVSSPLYQPLASELANQGIKVMSVNEASTALIDIHTNSMNKAIQSIGVNNRVQEYRLDYRVVFSVSLNGKVIIEQKELLHSRDYAFDISQITGSQQEEKILRDQLYKDMAEKIVRAIAR